VQYRPIQQLYGHIIGIYTRSGNRGEEGGAGKEGKGRWRRRRGEKGTTTVYTTV